MKNTFILFLSILGILSCKSKSETSTTQADSSTIRDISIEEAVKMMVEDDVITIDLRTPKEIADGKILDSAKELDYNGDHFKSELEKLDKNAQYVIYCRSGGRSGRTLEMMRQMGFKNACNVLGGIKEYNEKYGSEAMVESD